MESVSIRDGVVYGFRIMLYYIGVVLVGNLVGGLGGALLAAGADSQSAALIFGGFVLAVVGVVIFFAGLFGALYKLIADGVAKGRMMSPTDG